MKNQKGITIVSLIVTIIVMIILAGIALLFSVGEDGVINKANQAVEQTSIAQIKERAELVKSSLIVDSETNNNVTVNISTLKNRLLEEFEVTQTDTDGNNVIEVNDKYGIIIKNTDLELEVKEISSILLQDYATALNYEVENGKIEITIPKSPITMEEYFQKAQEEVINIPTETKLQAFLQGIYEMQFIPSMEEPLTSVDEVVILGTNEYYGTTYTTIEECLEDKTIQGEWGNKKENLYFGFNLIYLALSIEDSEEDYELTEQELLDSFYVEYILAEDNYFKYTMYLKLYVSQDGGAEEIIAKNIHISAIDRTYVYEVTKNGTYEFILRTKDEGTIVSSEIIQVNDIANTN